MQNTIQRRQNCRQNRGAAVLETIITLPILIAAVFSIVEFSMLVNRQQHLVEAARNGALVASRLSESELKASNSGTVPKSVAAAVEGRLEEANITNVDIRFSYGSQAQADVDAEHKSRGCDARTEPLRRSVRVAVKVPATELSPNLLSVFGFDISNRSYAASSVFPYER